MTPSLNLIRSGAQSQWKLARVFVIDRAAALSTDCRRLSKLAINQSIYLANYATTKMKKNVNKTM